MAENRTKTKTGGWGTTPGGATWVAPRPHPRRAADLCIFLGGGDFLVRVMRRGRWDSNRVPGPDKRSGQGRAAQLRRLPDQCARPTMKTPPAAARTQIRRENRRKEMRQDADLSSRGSPPAGRGIASPRLLARRERGIEVAGSIGEGDPCVRACGEGNWDESREKGRGRPVCLAVPRGQQRGWDGGGAFFFLVVVLRDDAYAKINK